MELQEAIKQWPSIEKRGIDVEVMSQVFGVTTTAQGALCIPLHSPTGLRVGQLIRTLSGDPKYRHEPPESSGYLYNYHRRPKESQVCTLVQESPFDVYAVYPLFSVALVGVNLDEMKIHCLERMRSKAYIFALDTDAAGIDAAFRSAQVLLKKGLTTIIYQHGLQIKQEYEQVCEIGQKMRPGTFMMV